MRRHETVGAHVVASVLRARPQESAREVLARLAAERPASVELVLVVADDGRLLGAVRLAKLFAAGERTLGEIAEAGFPCVTPDRDQERAASLALQHGVDALPVVDHDGRALGVMPAHALMQVLRREHVEDLHVLAGIQREASQARHAIEDPPLRRARHRLPWLFGHLLGGELRTGMLLGAVLGTVSFFPVWLAFGNARLAGAVATAILGAGTVAAALGMLLPWWFARRGGDPALGSGPVATVIQDVVSLLVYFAVVRAFGL